MADVHTNEGRSYNMSRIRATNTKPELVVRKALFAKGFRYRIHVKKMPGKPDIVLKKYNTVIFVHGCFWHGHTECKYFVVPKSNTDWWLEKIQRNKVLDQVNIEKLEALGWKVITVFECSLKAKKVKITIDKLINSCKKENHD